MYYYNFGLRESINKAGSPLHRIMTDKEFLIFVSDTSKLEYYCALSQTRPEQRLQQPLNHRWRSQTDSSSTRHANQTTVGKRNGKVGLRQKRAGVSRLNGTEHSKELEQGIGNLGEGELLARADPRSATERDVLPAGETRCQHGRSPQLTYLGVKHPPNAEIRVPALRAELVGVWAVHVLFPVQRVGCPPDRHALGDEDWLAAVLAASAG